MKVFITHTHDPYYNLALEEYLLRQWTENILLLWRNDSSVIVGRNQNTAEEVNAAFIEANAIPVVRRISGGGAVYHDLNNINFSFIVHCNNHETQRMHDFMQPMVAALNAMGIPAELDGRNDLAVQGTKISGNAQAIYRDRILHHGTLLFDADLERMAAALRGRPEKFLSKAAKSVRARVANLRSWLPDCSAEDLMTRLCTRLAPDRNASPLTLPPQEEAEVRRLCRSKYQTWDWNYGETPPFDFRHAGTFSGGTLEIRLSVQHGRIERCAFRGDFLSRCDPEPLVQALRGIPWRKEDVAAALSVFPLPLYMGTLTLNDILHCMFENAVDGAQS